MASTLWGEGGREGGGEREGEGGREGKEERVTKVERCFRSTPKGVLTAQDYGVAVMGSWQISQRPLTVHKGEWGDRLLSRVMAWCLVHWTLSH